MPNGLSFGQQQVCFGTKLAELLSTSIPQSGLIRGIALTQVQHFAFDLVKPHEIFMGPLLELIQVPLANLNPDISYIR